MRSYDIKVLDDKGKLNKTISIKPVKRKDLSDLVEANKTIIESFLKYNGGIGSALADDNVWIAMDKIAKLCPVIGKEDLGFDLELIDNDYGLLSKLFFTQNEQEETLDSSKQIKPSVISTLNYLDFPGEMGKALKKLRVQQEQEEKEEKQTKEK